MILQSLRESHRIHKEWEGRRRKESWTVADAIRKLLDQRSFDQAIIRHRLCALVERRPIDGGRPLRPTDASRTGRDHSENVLELDKGWFFLLLSEKEAGTIDDRQQFRTLDESVLARLRRNTIGFRVQSPRSPIKELDGSTLGLADAAGHAPERLRAILHALESLPSARLV